MNLWIITVNFGKNLLAVKSLIDSISYLKDNKSIKIGIADNASTNETFHELQKIGNNSTFDVRIFPYKTNLYYWPAAKRVIKKLKKFYKSYPDWIIVCNNDITFPDKSFLKKLSKLDKKKYPIIGPNIINRDGYELNPFMVSELSALQHIFWNIYFISYPTSILIYYMKVFIRLFKFKSKEKNTKINKKVYAVHGSAILFSDLFFQKGGYLDENFDMYGEELTLAEIAKKLDIPITFFKNLKIIHNEHSTTKLIDNRLLFIKAKQSYRYFISTYLK